MAVNPRVTGLGGDNGPLRCALSHAYCARTHIGRKSGNPFFGVGKNGRKLTRQYETIRSPVRTVSEGGGAVREQAFREEHLPLNCLDPKTC